MLYTNNDSHITATPARTGARKTASLPSSITGAQQNDVLRALPGSELEALFGELELVALTAGQQLYVIGSAIEYAYFPVSAIISLQYYTEDGVTTEIAVIGREGVAGGVMYAGELASNTAVVQAPGHAYRLKADTLRAAFSAGGAFAYQLMRYTSCLFAQLAQNVVGSRHSSIEQKLCRWLLERADRTTGDELRVTQELIATMLGVRRESITAAAGKLQDEGLIHCRRGIIVVLDRERMEDYAGSCYAAARVTAAPHSAASHSH